MSLFSKLFGGGGSRPEPEAEVYKDFRITPDPIREGGTFRIAARIEKEIGGEVKTHQLIRADTLEDQTAAAEASAAKARMLIDEQGDAIFR